VQHAHRPAAPTVAAPTTSDRTAEPTLHDLVGNAAIAAEMVRDGGQEVPLATWLLTELDAGKDTVDPAVQAAYDVSSQAAVDAMVSANDGGNHSYPGAAPPQWVTRLDAAIAAGNIDASRRSTIVSSWVTQCRPGYNDAFETGSPSNPFVFRKKASVSAFDAIQSFIAGFTVADCYSMAAAAELWGVASAMGKDAFDWSYSQWESNPRNQGKPFIAGVPAGTFLAKFTQAIPEAGGGQDVSTETAVVRGNGGTFAVRVGDKAYFKNHVDFKPAHPSSPWGGENVICSKIEVRNGVNVALWAGFGPYNEATADEILRDLWGVYQGPSETDHKKPAYSSYEAFVADPRGARLEIRSTTDGYRLDPKAIAGESERYAATRN
jgi:hypothetical protein